MPSPQRARLVLAWTIVVIAAGVAACTVVPPATMLLVELSVLTREAGPLFALATLAALPVILLVPSARTRQRVSMALLLAGCALMDARPLLAARKLPGFAYSMRYAVRGDANTTPLVERSIDYPAADGTRLQLLLVRAAGSAAQRTMIVVYGGAWSGGRPDQAIDVSRYFARRGFTVVALDYRHAPAHAYPAQIDDVRRSLWLVRDSANAWGVDTARVAIVGRSAGGHLAMLAAFAPNTGAPTLPIRAVVAIYAPFDLAKAYDDPPHPDPRDVRQVLRDFLGGTPRDVPAAFHEASPSTYVRGGLPTTLLIYATHDHLVQPKFGRLAADALAAAGNRVTYVELPWAEHGFDLLPNGIGSQYAIGLLEQFFARTL